MHFLKKDVVNNKGVFEELSNELNSKNQRKFTKKYIVLDKKLIKDRKKVEDKPTQNNDKTNKIRQRLYEFYFVTLPKFTEDLKTILNSYSGNLYTSVYQLVGNNLRSSGKPFKSKYNGENIYRNRNQS